MCVSHADPNAPCCCDCFNLQHIRRYSHIKNNPVNNSRHVGKLFYFPHVWQQTWLRSNSLIISLGKGKQSCISGNKTAWNVIQLVEYRNYSIYNYLYIFYTYIYNRYKIAASYRININIFIALSLSFATFNRWVQKCKQVHWDLISWFVGMRFCCYFFIIKFHIKIPLLFPLTYKPFKLPSSLTLNVIFFNHLKVSSKKSFS